MTIIESRLRNDPDLPSRTPLTIDQIFDALDLCLRNTYFINAGHFYEQTDGAAMGSSVSPVANLFMECFEEQVLSQYPEPPRIWKRYVDDTFALVHKGKVHKGIDQFVQFLNGMNPAIKFTFELEKENKLPFLNCCFHRDPTGSVNLQEANTY